MPLPAGFYSEDLLRKQMLYRQMQDQAQARAARPAAGRILYDMFPEGGQQQPVALPPPPSAPQAPPPGSMSPGGGNPAVMGPPPGQAAAGGGQPPVAAPQQQPAPPPQPMPRVAPFRGLPQAPAGPSSTPGDSIAPPPAAEQPKPNERQFDLKNIVASMRKGGVKPEEAMTVLEQLSPVMTAANRDELNHMRVELQANRAATEAAKAVWAAEKKARELKVKEEAEKRRAETATHQRKLMDARADAAAGGGGNISKRDYIYPAKEDGTANMESGPIGTRVMTKSGKTLTLNLEGRADPQLAGVTVSESKANKVNVKDTVRSSLVEGAAFNALNRMTELKTAHPTGTVSALFGTASDNPVGNAAYAAIRSQQSAEQQDIDAKWGAFIDEAIPVFTGGLRGSDAFRKFLIEQAPRAGTHDSVVEEKFRLFEENIKGTRNAFSNKFKNDPKMWGPGVTKEQVQGRSAAAKQPTKIKGDADYEKLPSGAEFIGPDGVKRRKP